MAGDGREMQAGYRIQVYYRGAGTFMSTNHTSSSLDELRALCQTDTFSGFLVRVVDGNGDVVFGPLLREPKDAFGLGNVAGVLGVPVIESDAAPAAARSSQDGYAIRAVHDDALTPIVSIDVPEDAARQIIRELWPDVDFWDAPGGGSMVIETPEEAKAIARILGHCHLLLAPGRHRWLFDVYLR